MSTLKLTRTGERRLLKHCGFVEKLSREQFNFGQLAFEYECGTVACFAGWLPKVFPKLVEWDRSENLDAGEMGIMHRESGSTHFAAVAAALFHIPFTTALYLLTPCNQAAVHDSLPSCSRFATPKQVARMLRKFIALAKKGEIEV